MEARVAAIRENIETIQERIQRAAQSAGRRADQVRLVVVTKAQPVDVVQAAVAAGARILGENYPEETLPKIQALGKPDGLAWHMIGHLQSRKANIVAEHFDAMHALDSLRLAEKLERQLAARERVLPVLLEFNVGGEVSKYGWQADDPAQWEGLLPEIEQILALPHLEVRGLMTMPPLYGDPQQTRPYFAQLRRLGDFLARRYSADRFVEYSMGTSADFEAAVQEGATFVRLGEAIVGPRPRKEGIIE
jgi:PLP dependent protein